MMNNRVSARTTVVVPHVKWQIHYANLCVKNEIHLNHIHSRIGSLSTQHCLCLCMAVRQSAYVTETSAYEFYLT